MYYITDYRKRAMDKILPYLLEFPEIIKIVEANADRYQAIEDVLWKIVDNFWVDNARGIFLTATANNEVTEIEYSDKADDAFTYGTKEPLKQAYGAGHYYSQTSYASGIKKDVSTDKIIRSIKSKIIINNTDGKLTDFIEALKNYFNADHVGILESYPLSVSITLGGDNLELSSSGNYEVIKKFLPSCVSLKNLYHNSGSFNINQLGQETSYGDSRYPIDISQTALGYKNFNQAINLSSDYNEYIKTNHNKFDENMYCCFEGELTKSHFGNFLFSSNDLNGNYFYIFVNQNNKFELVYNETSYETDIEAEVDKQYTFMLYNAENKLKLLIENGIRLSGKDKDKDKDKDISYITQQLLYQTPTIEIENFTTFEAPIYINGFIENNNILCGDFTYYCIIFGKLFKENELNEYTEYYTTGYGQKQILFNCYLNENHLEISSEDNSLSQNKIGHRELTLLQSDYLYSTVHGNGKYAYFNGNSGINYHLTNENLNYEVKDFDLTFNICEPLGFKTGTILSNFIGEDNNSFISISDNKALICSFIVYNIQTNQNETIVLSTNENILDDNEFNNFKLKYENSILYLYKNDKIIVEQKLENILIQNIPNLLKIGYNNSETDFYKGFIKDFNYKINYIKDGNIEPINLNISFIYTLRDDLNKIYYTNNGVRLITTPQLIYDTTKKDLYGNNLIGIR